MGAAATPDAPRRLACANASAVRPGYVGDSCSRDVGNTLLSPSLFSRDVVATSREAVVSIRRRRRGASRRSTDEAVDVVVSSGDAVAMTLGGRRLVRAAAAGAFVCRCRGFHLPRKAHCAYDTVSCRSVLRLCRPRGRPKAQTMGSGCSPMPGLPLYRRETGCRRRPESRRTVDPSARRGPRRS